MGRLLFGKMPDGIRLKYGIIKLEVYLWLFKILIVMTLERIHHTIIPISHAVLWGIGVLLGLFGTLFLEKETEYSNCILYLYNAHLIYVVFLFEVALTFMDMACEYSKKRIRGSVFWVLFRLFIIIPFIYIFSVLYYKYGHYGMLFLVVGVMAWLKWEIVHFGNNMRLFVIEVEGINIVSNRL